MKKVHILDRCEYCDGDAYVFVCEDVDAPGQLFERNDHGTFAMTVTTGRYVCDQVFIPGHFDAGTNLDVIAKDLLSVIIGIINTSDNQ